ncbi:hypothetical protein LCGC14_1755190 [marine sediment metagenome]|uniref:Uncharacterized protein n=1 Tax=marine sediment metagenome TaxID=412755 RepID=A0A0F9H2S9_9ZZZZ
MEIPILLGASPKTANPVEWIPIRFDSWLVKVEGLVDSRLTLHFNQPFAEIIDLSKMNREAFHGPCLVRAEFVKRGTEKNISIFAEEHHGD